MEARTLPDTAPGTGKTAVNTGKTAVNKTIHLPSPIGSTLQ